MSAAANSYDVLVIGAGHNGLTAAAYLAQAGQHVLVVERRPVLGGAAASEAVFPGCRVPTGAWDAALFAPEIAEDLRLANHGLDWLEPAARVHVIDGEGGELTLWRDHARTQRELAKFSAGDASQYTEFARQVRQMGGILRESLRHAPPDVPDLQAGQLLPYAGAGWMAWRGRQPAMLEFARRLPLPLADFLDEWFETPLLKAGLAAGALTGAFAGPRSIGTTLLLLYQAAFAQSAPIPAPRFVRDGIGQLSVALSSAARQFGAEIRTGVSIERLGFDGEKITAAELSTGETVRFTVAASSLSARQTFFGLVGPDRLDVQHVREVKNIRYRGSLGRLTLLLDGLPDSIKTRREALSGRFVLAGKLDDFERAYDAAKYGEIPPAPVLEGVIPTLLDPALAPPGKHLVSVNIRTLPYTLKVGDWASQRNGLAAQALDRLDGVFSGLRQRIEGQHLLTPEDYAETYALPDGDIHNGQMALDQIFIMRPIPAAARYRTPLDGLYLCGAGSHPGASVTGFPGLLAAQEILAQRTGRRRS